ncbi:MAG: 3-deoxy-D-manno-octulosonic acid transferase [Pirellulales bacterium]|nr:3-deoxy-D-manno-octulosonic acid transferase [Pirellulales bacterium]
MLANLLYLVALAAASPLVIYRAVRHGRYRRGIGQKLLGLSKLQAKQLRQDSTCIWIHAVSVGEVNLLGGLVRRFQIENRDCRIVISSSTDTGYDLAVKHFGNQQVFFCPLDFTWAVKRTLRHLAPEQLVLAELELWPNLIRIAKKSGCEVAVFNGRLSESSATGYRKFGWLTRPTFKRLGWVGCQDEDSAKRFANCGTPVERLEVTGSLKFDDAPKFRDTPEVQQRYQWAGIDPWHRVWIVGSTGPGEEQMALEIYQSLRRDHPELRLILVPRHAERFESVAELITGTGLNVHRRSSDSSLFDRQWDSDRVLLIDTIGELRYWWGVGQIATVGGSFGNRGGQNMLEPAGYGSAVSFGPNTKNFEEIARRLLSADGAVRASSQAELQAFVLRCLTDIPAADSLGRAARSMIGRHRGATERTVHALTRLRPQSIPQVARSAA